MNQNYVQEIKDRLKQAENKAWRRSAIAGLIKSFMAISIIFFCLTMLESIFHFNSTIRTVIVIIFIVVTILLLIIRFLIPFVKSLNIVENNDIYITAEKIGNNFPEIKDELLDVLQLADNPVGSRYSAELINAAFHSVYEKTKNLNFEIIAVNDEIKNLSKLMVSMITAVVFLIYFLPFLNSASFRLVKFENEFITPPKFIFNVDPGNITILKGKNQKITVTTTGEKPKQVKLFTKSVIESEFKGKILKSNSNGKFAKQFLHITNSFIYFAKSGSIESKYFKIDVVNTPIIKNLIVDITPPKYTKLLQITQRDNGNISTIFGSRVKLTFSSTKKIKNGTLIFSFNKQKKILFNGQNGKINFTPKKEGNYFIEIEDTAGNKNSNPIVYSINLIRDKYPTLEVILPKNNLNVVGNEQLPVELRIGDDFGCAKLLLHYKLSSTKFGKAETDFHSIKIKILRNTIEDNIYYNWDLSKLYLAVDDQVSYYFELFDNDKISGPKSVRSELMKLRVPSMDETFADVEKTQKQAKNDLAKTLEETKKLNKEINNLNNSLKRKEKKISWEEKKKIENTTKKFNQLEKKVEEIKNQITKTKNKLNKNNLLSKETLKKYNELQKLMKELASPEMKNALKKLQAMMKQMNRNNVQNSFQKFKINEEAFKKSLERTINLLKRIEIEQKLDELTKRTNDLEKRQKQLEQSTKQNKNGNTELQKKQNEITKDLQKLSDKMQDLQKMMNKVPQMPNNIMQKIMKQMQQQKNQQLSKKASQSLQQRQMEQSLKNQQRIAKNMSRLNQQMSAMKNQMQMQNQIQTMTEMMKIINQIIDLSKEEEQLRRSSKNISPSSKQADTNARKQEEIKNNLEKLLQQMSKLSQKTFAISPEMGKALGKSISNMSKSLMAMQNRNGSLASIEQSNAMGQLNEAAKMMNNALQSMMKPGGQGGGMMSLMQQLQKLSGQQMMLNKLTQQLSKNGMSQQQMAQLQRLAQQQSIIKKSLQKLNEEAKESGLTKKLPVNLDRILQDMKEVITGMKTQKLNDNLIKTQNRILSKLLDAQRSINERDFEKRRESNSGTDIARKSPRQLNLGKNKKSEQIRRELLNSKKEGYSHDYQKLIRKYFEELEKHKN